MGRIDAITCQAFITCSGTAAGSAFGIDAGGGVLAIRRSNITVTDSTGAASGLIFTGTSVLDESYFNEFTVTSAGAGHAIGIDAQDTVTVRCSSNVIKCTAPGAGNAYAYQIATGATLTATFDETIAAERFNPIGAATFEYILSESDGQLTVSRTFVTNEKGMEMCPSDRTWTAADPVNGIDYKKTYTIATGSVGGLIAFSGTAQWSVAGGALGAGNLFKNEGTFKNVPGTNNSFGSQYTFVNTAKYESDNGIISSLFNRIVLLQPTFRGINGGTLSITSDAAGVYYNPIVDTGATITNLRGINFPGGTINGTVTNYHYLNMSNFPGAGSANYRAINSAVNTPNWFLYHTGTALSRLDGGLQVGQRLTLTGFHNYTSTSPAQITSNQNNYALPSGTNSRFKVRLSTDASRTVTGIVPQTSGDAIYIINIGANDLVLAHQSGSSTAANRMISPTGADLTLGADEYAYLWYDDVTTRWRILESNGA